MCEITIRGMAFLWHQIRCMVSVLFLIGLHLEEPEVCNLLKSPLTFYCEGKDSLFIYIYLTKSDLYKVFSQYLVIYFRNVFLYLTIADDLSTTH